MSKIWRCPECETLNQGRKCVICGYEISGQTEHIPKKDQEPEIKSQPIKNECEQTSLKVHNNNGNIVLTHHSSDKSVPSSKSKSFIKVIAAVLAAVAVLGIAFLVKAFLLQINDPEKEQILTTENETSVSEVTASTLTSVPEKTETTNVVTVDENNTAMDSQKLCSEIITVVNGQRVKNNVPPLKYDNKAEDIANDILKDVIAGTYVKGTSMDYAYGKFDHMQCYYEEEFDFASVISETEAAEMLLKYEEENFSNKWLDEKYDYIGSAVYDYGDGTWGIVFTLCYNVEVQTTTTKAGIIIPDYRGLSVDEYTAELKRLGIPYQVLMEQSEDVSEGYVVLIVGGSVGEYYNGIHLITVYKAYTPEKRAEYITIRGEKYSTELTELDLDMDNYWELENEDIKSLDKMINLVSLNWWCSEITDLNPLKKLKKLECLNLRGVIEVYDDSGVIEPLGSITDISPLGGLTNLKTLRLDGNCISDIRPLKNLSNLTTLDLSYNDISDISPLEELANLTYLKLEGNPINDDSIDALKRAIPNCVIEY